MKHNKIVITIFSLHNAIRKRLMKIMKEHRMTKRP